MLSPISSDAQFQHVARYPANRDRCRRCGNPRTLHAADGSCGLARPPVASWAHGEWKYRSRAAWIVTGTAVMAALGGATWLLASSQTANAASASAFAVLVALILLAGRAALTDRRR